MIWASLKVVLRLFYCVAIPHSSNKSVHHWCRSGLGSMFGNSTDGVDALRTIKSMPETKGFSKKVLETSLVYQDCCSSVCPRNAFVPVGNRMLRRGSLPNREVHMWASRNGLFWNVGTNSEKQNSSLATAWGSRDDLSLTWTRQLSPNA